MTWSEQLLPGSFAGVPFLLRVHEESGSNRADVYELERTTKLEPLGLGAGRHRVEGFVVGDDAPAKAKNLRAALRLARGVLVHPFFGELTVHVETWNVGITRDEQQRISVAFDAVEYDPTLTVPVVDVTAAVDGAVSALRTAAKASFLDRFDVALGFGEMLTAAEAQIGALLDGVASTLGVVADARKAVDRIRQIRDDIEDLLNAPETLADAVLGLFADIADLLGLRVTVATIAGERATPVEAYPTPSGAVAVQNRLALLDLFAFGAMAASVELVPTWSFASWDAALDTRQSLIDAVQAAEDEAVADVLPALADLRGAIEDAVSALAGRFVPLRSLALSEPESAVLLAYRLYGNPDRADGIATRNDVADPGALLGALRVEVA